MFHHALAEGTEVDLVLTDLVMPGMGGRALGEALGALAPGLPVLYCSGYTGDEVVRRGLIAEGAEFMSKPFAPGELLQRVRALLDRVPRVS
jgi:DNA-binding response OmpR family regulator